MNADEFKKLLEFKEKFPTIGLDLVRALTEKSLAIPFDNFALGIFDTFKSRP
jgi:hypothetical protein